MTTENTALLSRTRLPRRARGAVFTGDDSQVALTRALFTRPEKLWQTSRPGMEICT
jgi:hypothetical protein